MKNKKNLSIMVMFFTVLTIGSSFVRAQNIITTTVISYDSLGFKASPTCKNGIIAVELEKLNNGYIYTVSYNPTKDGSEFFITKDGVDYPVKGWNGSYAKKHCPGVQIISAMNTSASQYTWEIILPLGATIEGKDIRVISYSISENEKDVAYDILCPNKKIWAKIRYKGKLYKLLCPHVNVDFRLPLELGW